MPSWTRMPPRTLPCRCRVRDDWREKQRSPTPKSGARLSRNMQLLKERAWLEIPMVYSNNRHSGDGEGHARRTRVPDTIRPPFSAGHRGHWEAP